MTPEQINAEFKESVLKDPENTYLYSEIARARFVIYSNPNEEPGKALKAYMVQKQVIEMLIGEVPDIEQKKKRSDKYDTIINWCKENHLYQTNANEIAEIGDVSYPTALKFIKDRPDLFYRLKKGVYEVRNPEIVRAEEEAKQK